MTTQLIKAIWIFYRKLIVPSLVLSGALGLLGLGVVGTFASNLMGWTYLLFCLVFQWYIYEIKSREEYYFYYNLGLSKVSLWVANVVLSFVIGLIFMLI